MTDSAELGKLLCKKGSPFRNIVTGLFVFLMAIAFGVIGIFAEDIFIQLILMVLSVVCGYAGYGVVVKGGRLLHIHENGVAFGDNALTFDEIEYYLRLDTRNHKMGIHVNTVIAMEFHPFDGPGRRKIRFSLTLGRKPDDEIEAFHDRIVKAIARRMKDQIVSDGHAAWMDGISFHRDGLHYTKKDGSQSVIPYNRIEELDIGLEEAVFGGKDKLIIRDVDTEKTIAKLPVDRRKCSPGIYLLQKICAKSRR